MKKTINNYINHIVFVIDKSSSMAGMSRDVVKVFDGQIEYLARRSKELDQETRVSVYLFANETECIIYDKDVLRLPSLADFYDVHGSTSLIDATLKSIADLKHTPELYGEHSFLVYSLTDGEENTSKQSPALLKQTIGTLPENWTVAVFVPNQIGVREAKNFGFPAENISVWSTTNAGVNEVGEVMRKATDNFMVSRATGVRGTKKLFSFDTSSVNKATVTKLLEPVLPKNYTIYHVRKHNDGDAIKDFIEKMSKKTYVNGSGYYQLTKKENIQSSKNICLRDNATGKVYSGDSARSLLGLPDHEVRVEPASHPQYAFFVQSTSYNRKLVADTELIVMV